MNHSDFKRLDWLQDQLSDGCAGTILSFTALPTGSVRLEIIPTVVNVTDEGVIDTPDCHLGKTVRAAIDAAMKAAAE